MKNIINANLDRLGICASAACAVHCIVTPFVLVLFPFTSLAFLEWEGFETGLLIVSLILASSSLAYSFFKVHKVIRPLLLASIGFFLFFIGKIFHYEIVEITFSVLGGIFVITAHFLNLKLSKKRLELS